MFTKTTKPRLRCESLESRETPALIATHDVYSVELGKTLTVAANIDPNGDIALHGLLFNDRSTTNPGRVITATFGNRLIYLDQSGGPMTELPPATSLRSSPTDPTQSINTDGSFTFIAPSAVPDGAVAVAFFYRISNDAGESATGVAVINLIQPDHGLVAAGADAGSGPHVRAYQAGTGILKFNFFPYETTFTGGVNVAVGDLNNDGYPDIATIPSVGGGPRLSIFDGKTGGKIIDQFVFDDPDFRGGANIAIGDFVGNGLNQIAVGAGDGGGPRVQILELVSRVFDADAKAVDPTAIVFTTTHSGLLNVIRDAFVFDPSQRGGVRVALGDIDGLGREHLIAAPGRGAAPTVSIWDSKETFGVPTGEFGGLVSSASLNITAGNPTFTGGLYVAAGDFTGTGVDSILVGSGSGAGTISIFNGKGGLVSSFAVPTAVGASLEGGPNGPGIGFNTTPNGTLLNATIPNVLLNLGVSAQTLVNRGGSRVAAVDWNGDGFDDIVVGNGPGNAPIFQVFDSKDYSEITHIQVFSTSFSGGLSVGAAAR